MVKSTMTLPLRPNPSIPPTITTSTPPLYWDIDQTAHAFSVSVRTINNWKNQGLLPYIKIGGTIRFDVEQCREIVRKRLTHHEQSELWAQKPPQPLGKRGRGRPRKQSI